jgi:hypothetical protein
MAKAKDKPAWLRWRSAKSPQIGRDAVNLRHVVVTDGGRVTVVPIYRDAAPGRPSNRALVCDVAFPIDAISDLRLSRFVASHVVAVAYDPGRERWICG